MSDRQQDQDSNQQSSSDTIETQGSYQKNTLLLLKAFSKTYRKVDIGFDAFVDFVSKYVDQYGDQYKQLQIFEKNTREILTTNLKALARKNQCELGYTSDGQGNCVSDESCASDPCQRQNGVLQ